MNAQQLGMFAPDTTTEQPRRTPVKAGHVIYEPKGRAREYAALACNTYGGRCGHQCAYCYVKDMAYGGDSWTKPPAPRDCLLDWVERLHSAILMLQRTGNAGTPVHLSFTCDPYQPIEVEHRITWATILELHNHDVPVAILTKGGSRALRDLDLFRPNDSFGTTLTLWDPGASTKWEPFAALPADRLNTMIAFYDAGIPTWASFEPVLDVEQAKTLMRQITPFCSRIKVGKLNYHEHAKTIDWRAWARDAKATLESLGYSPAGVDDPITHDERTYYIKDDLRRLL